VVARDGSLIGRFPVRRMIAVEGIGCLYKMMSEELVVQKTPAAGTLNSLSLPTPHNAAPLS
jgi:hypothetical protein